MATRYMPPVQVLRRMGGHAGLAAYFSSKKTKQMIGILDTTHPTEGYSLSVWYRRVDGRVIILAINTHGKDIWGQLSSREIQILKSRIANL